jgi:hypothetical protein
VKIGESNIDTSEWMNGCRRVNRRVGVGGVVESSSRRVVQLSARDSIDIRTFDRCYHFEGEISRKSPAKRGFEFGRNVIKSLGSIKRGVSR